MTIFYKRLLKAHNRYPYPGLKLDLGDKVPLSPLTQSRSVSYTYGKSDWKNLLTAYNGTAINYDEIGNPLTYRDGFTFTWSNGRQLATVTNANGNYSYGYDASGLRTSKTVSGVTTQYYWLGDKLQAQSTGNDYLIFLYDEASVPYGIIHKYGSTEITLHWLSHAPRQAFSVPPGLELY